MTVAPSKTGAMVPVSLTLVGAGMRRKNLYVVNVDVYETSLNVSKPLLDSAKLWKSTDPITLATVFFDTSLRSNLGLSNAAISLRFVRSVTTSQVVEAFNDAFVGLDAAEVARFKEQLSATVGSSGLKPGESVTFFWIGGGGLAITKNGQLNSVFDSQAVERRLFEVYIDPKRAVSPELLDNVVKTVASIA